MPSANKRFLPFRLVNPNWIIGASLIGLLLSAGCDRESGSYSGPPATIDDFVTISGDDPKTIGPAFDRIEHDWPEGSTTMLVESFRFLQDTQAKFAVPRVLNEKASIRNFKHPEIELKRIWNADYRPHPQYAEFKSKLYGRLSTNFSEYFDNDFPASIRLDEIQWGGVRRDGIPPLVDPKVLSVDEANYLDDTNVVFGVFINGEARCYPKRILAWHEMVKDHVGGVSINGVYCTLCGSMIVYYTEIDGKHYELGTSGFLYRSNKLMYDHATKSMWNTLKGEPVVGPLVGKGIQLKRHHVVTTTWGQWKTDHPDTTVLSLDTGHKRDYGEGVAYAPYFASDELMYGVPKIDRRLKNKAEVVALLFDAAPDQQLAVSAAFLMENRVYQGRLGKQDFVIITDDSGANRVYETGGHTFTTLLDQKTITDQRGQTWTVNELELSNGEQDTLKRLPAHRAFWFGWFSAYPKTELVK